MSSVARKDWDTTVRAHYKMLPNRFGLQVLRTLGFHMQWRARRRLLGKRRPPNAEASDMERNGFLVIPDFLDQADYKALRDYYYAEIDKHPKPDNAGPKLVAPTVADPRKKAPAPDIIARAFIDNARLNRIVEHCAAHAQNVGPLVRLHHYFVDESDIGIRETAQTDELHYDLPLYHMRAFYYLEDCTRENAAFEFAPGTHRVSLSRLYAEYRDSIVQSRAREGKPDAKAAPIRDDLLKLLDARPQPLEAPGNSLVLFNTMGLHRRGRFSRAGSREAILIDYRFLDTKANYDRYEGLARRLYR